MENNDEIAYAEVDEILQLLEKEYADRIPDKIKNFFKEERSKEYNPIIRTDIPLDEQNLNRDTFVILTVLNLNYWCDSEEEKQEILRELSENEEIKIQEQKELEEKYNPDNLFKNRKKSNNDSSQELALVEYKKENIIKKIINKIKKLFKRN